MARGRSLSDRGTPARRATAAPLAEWWPGPDSVHKISEWREMADAQRGSGEWMAAADLADLDDFANTYAVHSSVKEPDHLLTWGCGVSRDGDAARIWLLGRVARRNADGTARITTAAFPVATARDPQISGDDAKRELVWYLANRIEHEDGPLGPGEIPDVVEFSQEAMSPADGAALTLNHGGAPVDISALTPQSD